MNLREALFFRLVIVNLPVDWSLEFGYSCGTGSSFLIPRS